MNPLKVLYLEDSPFDSERLSRFLKKNLPSLSFLHVETEKAYRDALIDFNPDVVLSDHTLFQFNSIEALSILKEFNPNIPFILVTGTVSEEFAVTILKKGADDYILKENLSRLPTAILNALKERANKIEKESYEKMLVEKNLELNTLIYKITHDLRGPVCSILGLIELVRKSETEPDFDYLGKINDISRKLDNILQTLSETMYAKNAQFKSEKIDFNILLTEVLSKFEFIPEYSPVRVSVSVKTDGSFLSDIRILSSIVQNLIENAFKYRNQAIDDQRIKIEVTADSEKAKIIVKDNGIGISPEIKEKVFDMFYRGNNTTQGSGLGLYLVKTGIEKLRGDCQLESTPKNGSCFTVTLPSMHS